MNSQSPASLWENYLFLTQEIDRFLSKGDTEMLSDLLDQREKLQASLDQTDTAEFRKSPAGRKLLADIVAANTTAQRRLTRLRNQSQQQEQLSGAYDIMNRPVGNWMDSKG